MCGIIAVLRRRSRREAPAAELLTSAMTAAEQALDGGFDTAALAAAAKTLSDLDRQLKGVAGLWCLLTDDATAMSLQARLETLQQAVEDHERTLDQTTTTTTTDQATEQHNAALGEFKDALWAIHNDRMSHARAVSNLAGDDLPHLDAATAFSSLEIALSALDRLEVRGRDSAGVTILVSGIDVDDPRFAVAVANRSIDPLYQSGSAHADDGCLSFVYKYAAEIGELGDNVAALRDQIRSDDLLQLALREPGCEALVLGHTRWASVGIISEPNAHPLNQQETVETSGPCVLAALNGDVDNHRELTEQRGLALHPAITTDAKVIPTLISRTMAEGTDLAEAFRRTVTTFEGSVAIGAITARQPDRIALALRGSGQALYIGLCEDTFVVASGRRQQRVVTPANSKPDMF